MAYRHGVYGNEAATGLVAPRSIDAVLPFVVGTAPIHLASNGLDPAAQVHQLVLSNKYAESVAALGYSDDFEKYTLCEVMDLYQNVFNYAPVIYCNVLDPEIHKSAVEQKTYEITDAQVLLGEAVILDSVVVKATADGTALKAGTDYSLAWNSAHMAVLNVLDGGALKDATRVFAAFDVIDPSLVTAADIIGGYDALLKRSEGLELVSSCFPKFGKIVSHILAPGWSDNPMVAAVMTGKSQNISGLFKGISITDIPSDASGVEDYTEVSEWKRLNSFTDTYQVACWPMGKIGDKKYHLSTIYTACAALAAANHGDIPYASPSNKLSKMTAAVTKSGKELLLDLNQVNMLNENGIVTLLNWESGWMSWGTDMACFPSNTDPKDRFVNVRCMYNWYLARFILRWFQKVDAPMNRRLLENIQDSENIQINAYVAAGVLVGEKNGLEFRVEDNPTTDLIDGILRAHTYLTVPPPARVIENTVEYLPEDLLTIFL